MTDFTQDQVMALKNGGNANCNKVWMAKYKQGVDPAIPNSQDSNALKKFLTMKVGDD